MTTDQPSEPENTPEPRTTPSATTTMSGETLLMIGAALVLGVYVIFELITGDYFQSWVVLTSAFLVLVVPRVDRRATEQIAPMPVVLKALGYVIAATGLFEALDAIRYGRLDEAVVIIAALLAFGGYILCFLGARSIET